MATINQFPSNSWETPGKLQFWTPKWRFGRRFSFSIRWFSGSMLVVMGDCHSKISLLYVPFNSCKWMQAPRDTVTVVIFLQIKSGPKQIAHSLFIIIIHPSIHPCMPSIHPCMPSIHPCMPSIHPSMHAIHPSIHPSMHAIHACHPSIHPFIHRFYFSLLSSNFASAKTLQPSFKSSDRSQDIDAALLTLKELLDGWNLWMMLGKHMFTA